MNEPISDKLRFSVRVRPQPYGDGVTFHEYRILMWRDRRPVGSLDAPRREYRSRLEAFCAGRRKVAELRNHRLFAIDVTRTDIRHGEGRNCDTCPVAQALWRNQERMGLPRARFGFRVESYGAFVRTRGIVLTQHGYDSNGPDRFTGENDMPDVVFTHGRRVCVDSMMEYTQLFDERQDYESMGLKEWRENNGYDSSYGPPARAWPVSFVLDLDAMKTEKDEPVGVE